MKALASFQTHAADRYLTMLCDHFGKRVSAQCDAGMGWVQFPIGRCEMTASETQLDMLALADDQTRLNQVTHIVTSHLERFAFREHPTLEWHQPPG